MTQNQNTSFSALPAKRLTGRTARPYLRSATLFAAFAAFALSAAMLNGQATNLQAGVTATQAVISYAAPDAGVCSIEVHQGNLQGPLVHDVDPALFPGSNLDSRATNLVAGRKRVFVVGKRAAEPALDGFNYSRALQVYTAHAYRIVCGASVSTGEFTTTNAPVGAAYNDPLPADPNRPGQYAWPTIKWMDRTQSIVDPLTGFKIRQFDSPREASEFQGSGNFISARNAGAGTDWVNPSAVLADDSAAATYSNSTRGWLFLELGLGVYPSPTHSGLTPSANALVPSFNAWCSGIDCSTANSNDRSIQFCLTVDGVSCISDMLSAALSPCSSNCGGASFRFAGINDPQAILAEWFASHPANRQIDATNLAKRSGSVNRNGASVSLNFGDRFDLLWQAGSTITINNVVYTIASVDNDAALTLSGSPAGSDSAVQYAASNAGLLVRKMTASTHEISIQQVSYSYETGQAPVVEAGGDEDAYSNCSPTLVAGPNGEMGLHCQVAATMYWIGQDTGTVNRLGHTSPPYNGDPTGWPALPCQNGAFWDWSDGNAMYCVQRSNDAHLYLLKFTYNGNNADQGNLAAFQPVTVCGSAPCWNVTNLTQGAQALDLQMAAFHPEWARINFHAQLYTVFGRMGASNAITFIARSHPNNDTMAFIFRFDLNTKRIVSGTPTWRYWPLRWGGSHGPSNLNDPKWLQVSATFFRGPFTGTDTVPGNGPYYSTVTSGAIATAGQDCPARPADSPIAVSDWPSGTRCLTVTVDGEPGDPTPAQYSAGTVSVSGTAVTGTNTSWNSSMDQLQILIGGTYYKFTYVSPTQGTLDNSAGTISNSAYALFLEPVNNPKVGNPNFAYLQDAEVRDIFCAANNQSACRYLYSVNEFMRLIVKNGNTWTLQRSWAGSLPPPATHPLDPNGWLIAVVGTCYFGDIYPCPESRVTWNAVADPYGYNAAGNTVLEDANEKGCCHATRQNDVNVDVAIVYPARTPGEGYYFTRFNGIPAVFADPGFLTSQNPFFHGIAGVGAPNAVDSHPSHQQFAPNASVADLSWMGDARPFLGSDTFEFGSPSAPGTLVSGTLYKFTSSQAKRLHPRILPTMAACGVNPLLDVSGASSSISTSSTDNYKYCVALTGGECVPGSNSGDVYVNCPQIKAPYCTYQGVGSSDPDTRDICVLDMGSMTMNATQVGITKVDIDGIYSRRVTAALSRYHWVNQFWNVKILPDGKSLIVMSSFLQGQRNALLLVKLPPFPSPDGANRRDFLPHTVNVPTPQLPGVTNAVIQFGYDKNYFCSSRREACVQGAVTDPVNVPFNYKSENPAGVPCQNGCAIPVQAISQRILYYQVILRDASNNVVGAMSPEVVAIK